MRIKPITIDFETDKIESRPSYPPKPVGFSILNPGDRKSTYYGWGHPTGNNTTKAAATTVLKAAWKSGQPLLFHHAKFDVDVAQTHMGMGNLDWRRVHDTMYLLFLHDPHARSLALKPSAEKILGMAPEEREAVKDWLIDHGILKKQSGGRWGEYIAKADGKVVGTYADGDTQRTRKLFDYIYPSIIARGMGPAYDRERELMFILLEQERQGVRVALPQLRSDLILFESHLLSVDNWLRKRLKVKDLNIDSDRDLAEALDNAGTVREWTLTPSGQKSVAKKNLGPDQFRDKKVASALGYRNRLSTCIGTFMKPWLEMAEASDGIIYTNWNQVRQSSSEDSFSGARTGRMSSTPNFQNIPKSFDDKDDGYVHPAHLPVDPLPLMRKYILPDKGGVFCHRDYNQQELRILGHFEDAALMKAYNDNPRLDVHDFVGNAIKELIGLSLERRSIKIFNFGMIYGMGLGKLAIGVNSTVEDAKRIKNAQMTAMPGLKELTKSITDRGKSGLPIRTWGGREYYTEPPKIIDGRTQTFEYKLLNYLIQGSAADCTKQAIINYHAIKRDGRFLITVHDENNISAPTKAVKTEMAILREAMQAVQFDVPMLSDGKTGKSWGDLTKFKEPA